MPRRRTSPPSRQLLFLLLGWLSLTLGFIGIFLPLLPTVPFVILAAFFFSKGSERWHEWLIRHPRYGKPIRQWREQGVIPLRAKIASTAMMAGSALMLGFSGQIPAWARIAAGTCLAGTSAFVWSRPSRPKKL
ncbi:MAG: YbaN family protein [Bdellovibrionales bacterium]|nr:YbaN family protein [Bdellovibrionales bacterium]